MMYLGVFYQFPKFRQNRPKNARFLTKNGNFLRFSGIQIKKKCSAENVSSPWALSYRKYRKSSS